MTTQLINAVVKQLGYSSSTNKELLSTCRDICNHGIQGGYGGFCYYSDTVKFFDQNKIAIVKLANETAESIGYSLSDSTTVKKMRELDKEASNDKEMKEVKTFLFRTFDSDAVAMILNFGSWKDVVSMQQMKNLLSWFAAEEVARQLTDN